MDLTDKAKEEFLKWCKKRCNIKLHELIKMEMWINIQDEAFVNSITIEWLDSIGIYIDTYICTDGTYDFKVNFRGYNVFCNSRQEATKQAIIKANKIYNERE